jgi:DNA-binding transcriptional regulator LsrR (DeoR family)
MKAGRPKNEKAAIQAWEYYEKGLKHTEIAKLMNTSKWQVRRWIFYVQNGDVKLPKNEG